MIPIYQPPLEAINQAEQLISCLAERGFDIESAFFRCEIERYQWRLVIHTPLDEAKGMRYCYATILEALRATYGPLEGVDITISRDRCYSSIPDISIRPRQQLGTLAVER